MFRSLVWFALLSLPLAASAQAPLASAEAPLAPAQPSDPPAPIEEPAPQPASPFADPGNGFGLGMGGMGMGGMGGPGTFGGGTGSGFQTTWMPSQSVKGQDSHIGWVSEQLTIGGPLWRNETTMLCGSIGVGNQLFDTNAVLPQNGKPFPDQLWNVHAGLTAMHQLGDGWMIGGGVNVGSASDKPFSNFNTLNAGVNAMMRIPWGERDSWLLSLSYSPLGQLPIPIPGVAYVWNPNDQFQAHLGVPLSFRWRPDDRWTVEASYMLLTTVRSRITYRFAERWALYGGFDWHNQGWFLSNAERSSPDASTSSSQRFLYYEKRVGGGLRFKGDLATLDLGAGYAFDRYFTQGSLLGTNQSDRLPLRSGPYLSATLRW